MPIFNLANIEDQNKLGLIRVMAKESGLIHCISSVPSHECSAFQSDTIILVIYNGAFKPALQDILGKVFNKFGPEPYGMAADTSEEEFIELKLGTCICGFSTF